MVLYSLPLWLLLLMFAIVILVGGVLLWYFAKLLWYVLGRLQESEFDKVKKVDLTSGSSPSLRTYKTMNRVALREPKAATSSGTSDERHPLAGRQKVSASSAL